MNSNANPFVESLMKAAVLNNYVKFRFINTYNPHIIEAEIAKSESIELKLLHPRTS